jgi:hypothetical protein
LPRISVKKDVNTGCCMAFADTRNITPTMGVMLLHGRWTTQTWWVTR